VAITFPAIGNLQLVQLPDNGTADAT